MISVKPATAKLTITDENDHLHEVELNAAFAATLYKAIRKGPKRFDLTGCLPPGSSHATPERQHWQIFPQNFGVTDLEGWEV